MCVRDGQKDLKLNDCVIANGRFHSLFKILKNRTKHLNWMSADDGAYPPLFVYGDQPFLASRGPYSAGIGQALIILLSLDQFTEGGFAVVDELLTVANTHTRSIHTAHSCVEDQARKKPNIEVIFKIFETV